MVTFPAQGDIITIDGIEHRMLVISNQVFNNAGGVIACPIVKTGSVGALHFSIETQTVSGIALCEQMKFFLLSKRAFHIWGSISLYQLMDISDAAQGIFEYI